MTSSSKSKASDDESAGTVKNAVDRASSRTPLNDDSGIDPAQTRDKVLSKREAENRGERPPANPNVGPGAVRAQPNQVDERSHDKPAEPPPEYKTQLQNLPERTAKEKVRQDLSKDVEGVKKRIDRG